MEGWSGVGRIQGAAIKEGLRGVPFDITDDYANNFLKVAGLQQFINFALRVKEGGLVWLAPVCSTFVWANSANTQRTKQNPDGDKHYNQTGHIFASICALIIQLSICLGFHVIVENPFRSLIFECSFLKPTLDHLKTIGRFFIANRVPMCAFDTKKFGLRFNKPLTFVGTAPWLPELEEKPCRCPNSKHATLMRTYYRDDGKKQVCGNQKQLKTSAAYPKKFGTFVIKTWLSKKRNTFKAAACAEHIYILPPPIIPFRTTRDVSGAWV